MFDIALKIVKSFFPKNLKGFKLYVHIYVMFVYGHVSAGVHGVQKRAPVLLELA